MALPITEDGHTCQQIGAHITCHAPAARGCPYARPCKRWHYPSQKMGTHVPAVRHAHHMPPTCSTRLPLRKILRVMPVTGDGRGCAALPPPPRPPAAAREAGAGADFEPGSSLAPAHIDC
eukprot:1158938-Pelagomonas_calceolata.AAC.8